MKISIAIPCYEMFGFGTSMLNYSFSILEEQTLTDFEVVISDHSRNNNIETMCKRHKNLNIKYIRNEENRGSLSGNVNNAILNSSGELIKILCQDDFLYDKYSLEKTVSNFDYEKRWLVTPYFHTKNREELTNIKVPKISENLYINNTIGTHSSLTILNENPLLFDENLIWFMDCEYYYRLYKTYGEPFILFMPTVVQLLWEGQVTNTVVNEEMVRAERLYLKGKHGKNE